MRTAMPPIHGYLAGPDVFFPDAHARGEAKKAILAARGIVGIFPLDNVLDPGAYPDHRAFAHAIARANEDLMAACAAPGQVGLILANMTPYHGPSMDVGTAFEMGFMSALAMSGDDVLIFGYTDDPRPFEARVLEDHFGGAEGHLEAEVLRAPDGTMVEAFGLADNLMITHAIEKTGGAVCATLEEAADRAVERVRRRFAGDAP